MGSWPLRSMRLAINFLKSSIYSKTAKDSIYLLIGVVVSTMAGFLLTITLTRNLSAADFGLIVTALVFSQMVVDFSELGLNSALLTFGSKNSGGRNEYLKASFVLRVAISLVIGLVIILFSNQIGELLFKSSLISKFLSVSALGIVLIAFISWLQSLLQSRLKFLTSSTIGSLVNITRLVIVFILLSLGINNSFEVYISLQVIILVVLVLGIFYTDWSFLKEKLSSEKLFENLKFGVPVGLGFSVAALYTKLDQLIIFNISGEVEAGVYGVALRVASVFIFASAAFGNALVPRFASIDGDRFSTYFKKSLLASLGLCIFPLIAIIISPVLIPLLFGDIYSRSVLPFQILCLGMSSFTLTTPFSGAILYRFRKPLFSFWSSLVALALIIGLFYILIPQYKSVGAAMSVSFVYFVQLIWTIGFYFYFSKRS